MVAARVFAESWQYLAHAEELAGEGALLPRTLLPGCLDEPLLLVRDGGLRALSNVCTHRGAILCDAERRAGPIRCPYHGRRFDLAGRCLSAPGFQPSPTFPGAQDHLASAALEQFGPLWFASLTPSAPLSRLMAPLHARLDFLALERTQFSAEHSRDYVFDAPWNLYVDNFLEGLHVPFVHPALARGLDLDDYPIELFEAASLQIGVARAGERAFELPPEHPDHGRRVAAWYFWLFPNTMLNVYPFGLSLNVVEPLGPSRTRVRFLSFLFAGESPSGAGADLDRVEREDEAIVLSVARGSGSRLRGPGSYADTAERAVQHFHRLLEPYRAPGA